ncbi:hypothetical protein DL93DRAFT_1845798 [Clavulina sp. PMI_390]|nr:hypothetical protein DL93DRAFT_1845798 [Clavulina sp. PMI_390]
MDAISFVLGVKSAQLRSSQLKDLVYRGRRLGQVIEDGDDNVVDPNPEGEEDEDEGEGTAKKAWVLAVYEDAASKQQYQFQRTISVTGASEYRLNNKVVSYQAYNATLEKHNILVKAKNFLVFQVSAIYGGFWTTTAGANILHIGRCRSCGISIFQRFD